MNRRIFLKGLVGVAGIAAAPRLLAAEVKTAVEAPQAFNLAKPRDEGKPFVYDGNEWFDQQDMMDRYRESERMAAFTDAMIKQVAQSWEVPYDLLIGKRGV